MDKKNKNPNVPNLRFNQFNSEWERKSIGDLINEVKEYTSSFEKYPLYSFTIESGVTPKTERYERNFLVKKDGDLFKVVHPNNFVMNPMNLRFGAINYSKQTIDVSVSGYYDIFEIDNSNYNDFWNAYFKAPQTINTYNSIATGSLVEKKRVHFSQLKSLKFYLPSNDEKEKINSFIKLLDDRISVQIKIINDYKMLKKSIVERIISTTDISWNRYSFKDIFRERKEFHVKDGTIIHATLSKEGIYPKTDRYDRDFLVKDEDKKYKVSYLNDICYNPANLKFGVITRNDYGKCIVPPIYVTYMVNPGFNPKFIELFVTRTAFLKEIRRYEQGTVYERMAVSSDDFLTFETKLPNVEVQNDIVDNIDMLDKKITQEQEYLELLDKQKDYLLSNMFI
mgnify:CR=1 FL=1